ncbi:MAG: hypothetical protein WCD26_22185, partial [Pseudolabrys sp.]
NVLSRSGVALWCTVKPFLVRQRSAKLARQKGRISKAFVWFSFDAELIDRPDELTAACAIFDAEKP